MSSSLSTFDPEQAENLEDIEKQFAVKAVTHAETYWNLLSTRYGSDIQLSPFDSEIYDDFVDSFPEYVEDTERARVLNEDEMKSPEGKKRWREFMNKYEKKIDDFNFGTLLRLDANGEYGEANTMFSVKLQFYAIEIFRNRHGMNDWIKDKADKEKKDKDAKESK